MWSGSGISKVELKTWLCGQEAWWMRGAMTQDPSLWAGGSEVF